MEHIVASLYDILEVKDDMDDESFTSISNAGFLINSLLIQALTGFNICEQYVIFSIWSCDTTMPSMEKIGNVELTDVNGASIILNDNGLIEMRLPEPSLVMSILGISSRYITMPLTFSMDREDSNSSHAVVIVIDNVLKELRILDPNGQSDYFDSNIIGDVLDMSLINQLLNYYISEYAKEIDPKIKYISQDNQKAFSINRHFGGDNFGGLCASCCLLFARLFATINMSVDEVIDILNGLSDDELRSVITKTGMHAINTVPKILSSDKEHEIWQKYRYEIIPEIIEKRAIEMSLGKL